MFFFVIDEIRVEERLLEGSVFYKINRVINSNRFNIIVNKCVNCDFKNNLYVKFKFSMYMYI